MLVSIAIFLQFPGQVIWEKPADPVHDLVAQMPRNNFETARKAVEPALEGKQSGQPARSQISDGQKDVLTVRFSDIERTAMYIFSVNRHCLRLRKAGSGLH